MDITAFKTQRQRQCNSESLHRLNRDVQLAVQRRLRMAQRSAPLVRPLPSYLITTTTNPSDHSTLIPIAHRSSTKKGSTLVPVRLELDVLKLRDFVLLELSSSEEENGTNGPSVQVVRGLLAQTLVDYGLVPPQMLPTLSTNGHFRAVFDNVLHQLADFRAFWERWLSTMRSPEGNLVEAPYNVLIKLDILCEGSRLQLVDQFEWPLDDRADEGIEAFASKYVRELCLPRDVAPGVAFCMREQLFLARRAYLACAMEPAQDESLKALLTVRTESSKPCSPGPYVQFLSESAYDKAEQSHERSRRRFRRDVPKLSIPVSVLVSNAQAPSSASASSGAVSNVPRRRRGGGDGWSMPGSPPRLHCMPVNRKFPADAIALFLGDVGEGGSGESPSSRASPIPASDSLEPSPRKPRRGSGKRGRGSRR